MAAPPWVAQPKKKEVHMYKKLKTWRGNKNTQIAHVSLLSILFEKSLVFEKWLEYVQKKLFLVAR